MPISASAIRHSSLLIAAKNPNYSLKKYLLFSTCSSIAAEQFLIHLGKDQTHVEKTLNTVKAKLDSLCVAQVVERCAIDKPQLGIRFFIWAGLHPNHRHTSYMYNKACKLLDVEQNPRIIVDVIDGYMAEGFVVSIKMFKVVLNLCRAAKDAKLGLLVLRKMKEFNCRPDTVSYNLVIRLLVEKSQLDEALGLMREMGLIDLYPDMVTYVSIIKGFCDAGRLEDAFGLIKLMKGHGCVANAVVYSTILDGICTHGNLDMASELLCGMEKEDGDCKPNVVTYTTMIKGFVEKGRAKEALKILDRMDESRIKPNIVTFAAILDGLCKQGHVEEACGVVNRFSEGGGGVENDELYSLLVMSLMRAGKKNESENIFSKMMARGMRPNGLASSNIIRTMVLEGRVMDGFRVFDALQKSGNLVAVHSDVYSNLLAGLCEENCFVEAARIVSVMVEGRIRLKSTCAENIIERLNVCGECDLANEVASINR
ncbi:hypothetical protein ABFS82_14G281500 [Erythranthe guttata]|nr:PREDICTED: pentatricopeptide repeat-containing protein At5g47360 [Erythranthe guttata]|eukprot:XP_012838247.1 PREDICTED: pentatricopeptide repeat-containing protein At5g47360 [Erythranthe guttata]